MKAFSRRLWVAATAVTTACPALAHDGHGLSGAHWHTTDVWGFVGLAIAVAVAVWLSGGGKP